MPTQLIVLTCGGTGGHIYPAIAVAQELSEYKAIFIGSTDRSDREIIPKYGYTYHSISSSTGNPLKMTIAFWQARRLLKRLKPKAIVSTGGYHTLPVVLAAKSARIPIFLLEQNAIPGRVNRFLAPLAKQIFLTFKESQPYFNSNRVQVLGNPIRKSFLKDATYTALKNLPLNGRKWLLNLGGSQGAAALNNFLIENRTHLIKHRIGCIQLTGPGHYEPVCTELRDKLSESSIKIEEIAKGVTVVSENKTPIWIIISYCETMDWLYQQAEWVFCRAGATTISELTHFQKPAIMVPYPYAKDNHQTHNAKLLEQCGQGKQIPQDALNWETFYNALHELKSSPDNQARSNAAEKIGNAIRKSI